MLFGGITIVSVLAAAVNCIYRGDFSAFGFLATMLGGFAACFGVLTLAAAAFLFLLSALVDTGKPQTRDSKFYRAVMYVYIEALMNLAMVDLYTQGLEKTPASGRFVVVCNHLKVADPGILLHCFHRSQLTFVSKQENMAIPVVGKFMHKIMCQTIDRDNDRQALKAILRCIQLLKDDQVSIGVFPEGYTSRDGRLHHFRSGVFRIPQKAGVPIVVCTIRGTWELFDNLRHFRRSRVELHLLEVIPPEELKGRSTVEIGRRVWDMMAADLGETGEDGTAE